MTADHIAYLALLASLVSLVVSFLALHRDQPVVRASADAVIDLQGVCHLTVSVSNSGKRPISINHVLIRPRGHPGTYINFSADGRNRVDVGESRGCQISPLVLPVTWANIEQLHALEVFVADAIGKLHKANFQGKRSNLLQMKNFWFSRR